MTMSESKQLVSLEGALRKDLIHTWFRKFPQDLVCLWFTRPNGFEVARNWRQLEIRVFPELEAEHGTD